MARIRIEKYEGLDLSDYEIMQRSIRDVNSKLDRLAREYGVDSYIYKQNLAKVETIFPMGIHRNRYLTTDKGVAHISQKIKMDIREEEYLEKAKLLTEKVQTIGQVKTYAEKAIKEIYGQNIDINKVSKTQQNRLIKNITQLRGDWNTILHNFYNLDVFYGQYEATGLRPDTIEEILRDTETYRTHPDLMRDIQINERIADSKDNQGRKIVYNTPKKTYNDMNNLILITEAFQEVIDKLQDDADIYERYVSTGGIYD